MDLLKVTSGFQLRMTKWGVFPGKFSEISDLPAQLSAR
jgi:hypothetical protein